MLTERISSVSSWTSMTNNRHLSDLEPMSRLLPKRPLPIYGLHSEVQNPIQSIRFMLPTHIDFFREEKSQSDGGHKIENDINILTKIFMDSNKSILIELQGTPPEDVEGLLRLEIKFFRALKKLIGIPPCIPAEIIEINYKNMLNVIHRNIEYALGIQRIKSDFKSTDSKNKNTSKQASEEKKQTKKGLQPNVTSISSHISNTCEKPIPIKEEVKGLQTFSTESTANPMVYYFKKLEKFSSENVQSKPEDLNCRHMSGTSKIVYSEISNIFYLDEDYFENLWPFLQTAPTEEHILAGKFLSEQNQDVICLSWKINPSGGEVRLAQKALNTIWAKSEVGENIINPFCMRVFSSKNIKKSVINFIEKDAYLHNNDYYKNINLNIYI